LISSISQSEELRVLENRMPRRKSGPKREEVTGRYRKLYNERFRNLYSSTNIIGEIKLGRVEWAGNLVYVGEMKNPYKILIGKPCQQLNPNQSVQCQLFTRRGNLI
jgi:hypothetical protein